jgi:hypothetical protein
VINKKSLIHQAAFIQSPYRFIEARFHFLIAGYAAGKTSALTDALIKAIIHFSGKRDKEGKPPKIGVCGITLTFLKKTFSGGFVQMLAGSKSTYQYDKAHNIIYIAGVELHLTPIIDEETIFGFDWCACFVDELDELPTYKAIAVVKALNDRCRQAIPGCRPPFLAFATTSQGLKGTYQVVESFRKIGMNFVIVRGRTRDNIYLDKEYVESMYKIYNEKERKCLLEGEFISIDSGLVYPDYNPKDHRLDYDLYQGLDPKETVYIGQDFNSGFNKAVAIICREGVIYVIKEYSFPDVRRAPEVFRYDFPYNRIRWIPDATNNAHLPDYKKELRANQIEVIYRTKNPLVKDRTFLINKLFFSERMYLTPFCKELDNALIVRQNDKDTGMPMKGKGETAPDHICDSLEYSVSYVTSWLKEFKDLYKITLGRRIEKRIEAGLSTEEEETYMDEKTAESREEIQIS